MHGKKSLYLINVIYSCYGKAELHESSVSHVPTEIILMLLKKHYYQCWKQLSSVIFFVEAVIHFCCHVFQETSGEGELWIRLWWASTVHALATRFPLDSRLSLGSVWCGWGKVSVAWKITVCDRNRCCREEQPVATAEHRASRFTGNPQTTNELCPFRQNTHTHTYTLFSYLCRDSPST